MNFDITKPSHRHIIPNKAALRLWADRKIKFAAISADQRGVEKRLEKKYSDVLDRVGMRLVKRYETIKIFVGSTASRIKLQELSGFGCDLASMLERASLQGKYTLIEDKLCVPFSTPDLLNEIDAGFFIYDPDHSRNDLMFFYEVDFPIKHLSEEYLRHFTMKILLSDILSVHRCNGVILMPFAKFEAVFNAPLELNSSYQRDYDMKPFVSNVRIQRTSPV